MDKARILTINQIIIGELLIRYILCNFYDMNINQIIIQRTNKGKPYLYNCPLEFNISHSGIYVVCVCERFPIGIDIEEIRDDRILNPYILSAKEAYYKFFGGATEYEKIEMISCMTHKKNTIYVMDRKNIRVFQNEFQNNFILSVCCEKYENKQRNIIYSSKDFFDNLKGFLN